MTYPSDEERQTADPATSIFGVEPTGYTPVPMPTWDADGPTGRTTAEPPPDPGMPSGSLTIDDMSVVRFLLWCFILPVGLFIGAALGLVGYEILKWIFF